ncbi:MAG: hypothetical protein R3C61_15530 [Bacteroidia bacterium]
MQVIDSYHLSQLVENSAKPYVLVNFYTTQSETCVKEIPGLIQLSKNPEEPVEVLFVMVEDPGTFHQDPPGFWKKFLTRHRSFHLNEENAGAFVRQYLPDWQSEVPLNLLLTNTGRLVVATGMTDPMEVRMLISKHESFYFQ